MLSDIRTLLSADVDAEIMIEANPGTFEARRFRSYRASDMNRPSTDTQSLNDAYLQALGRIRNAAEAHTTINMIRVHSDNINPGLMFVLPGQTLVEHEAGVEAVLSFDMNHVPLYHLTLESSTYSVKYPPALPDNNAALAT